MVIPLLAYSCTCLIDKAACTCGTMWQLAASSIDMRVWSSSSVLHCSSTPALDCTVCLMALHPSSSQDTSKVLPCTCLFHSKSFQHTCTQSHTQQDRQTAKRITCVATYIPASLRQPVNAAHPACGTVCDLPTFCSVGCQGTWHHQNRHIAAAAAADGSSSTTQAPHTMKVACGRSHTVTLQIQPFKPLNQSHMASRTAACCAQNIPLYALALDPAWTPADVRYRCCMYCCCMHHSLNHSCTNCGCLESCCPYRFRTYCGRLYRCGRYRCSMYRCSMYRCCKYRCGLYRCGLYRCCRQCC